jgi:uncharacterized membrane protein
MLQVQQLTPRAFGDPLLRITIAAGVQRYPRAFKWLLCIYVVLVIGVGAIFATRGAIPVIGFSGLEILLLLALLRVSFRRAAEEEALSLASDHLIVSRAGAEAARLQSYWLQMERAPRGIMLRSRRDRVTVGSGLGAGELNELFKVLQNGLERAKTVRHE